MFREIRSAASDSEIALNGLENAIADLERKDRPPEEEENELRSALDRLLDQIEEHLGELPPAPRLRAASREACEATGRTGNLIYLV